MRLKLKRDDVKAQPQATDLRISFEALRKSI